MNLVFIICPDCKQKNTYTKEILGDSDSKLNLRAILGCYDCNSTWEGLIGRPEVIEAIKPQARTQAGVE